MSVTDKEIEYIVQLAMERTLAMIPEVVGNQMKAQAMYSRLVEDFYNNHKQFRDHKEIVQEVVARIEGSDPTLSYEQIFEQAVPKIKAGILNKGRVTMSLPERKQLKLQFDEDISSNGEI
jgi:hypothetical protein